MRYLFSLSLDALELARRNASKLSPEIDDIMELEKSKELRNVIGEIRVNEYACETRIIEIHRSIKRMAGYRCSRRARECQGAAPKQ